MKMEKLNADHIRAALRAVEQKIKSLLDLIELNDANNEAVAHQIRHIEEGLKKIRRAA